MCRVAVLGSRVLDRGGADASTDKVKDAGSCGRGACGRVGAGGEGCAELGNGTDGNTIPRQSLFDLLLIQGAGATPATNVD